MRINEEPKNERSLTPLIRGLGILTVVYAIGLLAHLGRNQGLWFWYVSLRHTDWDLPTWAFAPAYALFYGALGTALIKAWEFRDSRRRLQTILLVAAVSVLACISSWVLFGLRQITYAMALDFVQVFAGVSCVLTARRTSILISTLVGICVLWTTYMGLIQFWLFRNNR